MRARDPGLRCVALLAMATTCGAACTFDPAALPELRFELDADATWPAPTTLPAPGPGEGRIYVSNNLEDTVTVLDLDSAEAGAPVVVGTVPVGFVPVEREGPHHVAVEPSGEHYYVGISNFVPGAGFGPHGAHGDGTEDGHVLKLRVADNVLVASARTDPNPGDVRLTPDGRFALATHYDTAKIARATADGITSGPELDARLAIVDTATMGRPTLVDLCPAAHGIAITSDSAIAVTSCESDEAAVVDLADPAHAVTRVALLDAPGTAADPLCGPYAVTLDDGGSRAAAWVSCYLTGLLVAVDLGAGASGAARDGRTLQLPGRALFGHAVAGRLVIAHQGTDGITVVDTTGAQPIVASSRVLTPDVCTLPHFARWSDDGASIFLVCEGNKSDPGAFVVLDAAPPHDVRGAVALGLFPDDMAVMRRPP